MISASREKRLRAALILLLGAVAAAAFAIRILSIAEPLGIDQSLWASAARGMAHGLRLYHDVWEQRPPGIYWIYLAGFRVFGWTPATVAWLDILASAATCLFLMAAVRRLAGGLTAALTAALYATLTMPSWLYGHGGFLERSVCETFIATCVAVGTWSAVEIRRRGSPGAAAALGLSAGAAVVLKPNAGLYLPALLLWVAFYARRPAVARLVVIAALTAGVAPLAALLWLWRLDLLHDARVAVVDFNRFYVSQGFTAAAYILDFSRAVWLRIKTDPLWLAGTMGGVVAVWDLARRRRLPPLPGLALILACAALLVIVVNGARLFNSYFMNALPPLSLMAAWLLGTGWKHGRRRGALAATALLLMIVVMTRRDYVGRVFEWAQLDIAQLRGRSDPRAYLERFGSYANQRGYSARANAELAEYVRSHTAPGDRIFLFGISGAGVYFLSDRLPAHRFLRANFFVETDFPDPRFRLGAVVAELAAAHPRYLIFEELHTGTAMANAVDDLPNDPGVRALLRDYRFETRIEDFRLYRSVDQPFR